MDTVKIGIIGAGAIAREHLKVLKDIPGMKAVGITSRTKAKAEQLSQEYGIEIVADSLDELVERAKPDALMVLVSVEQMYAVTRQALNHKLPLFIEKPAGMLPEENQKLAASAQEAQVRTMVGFNRRYYSIFKKGLEIIQARGPLLGVQVEGHERMWRIREGEKFSKAELDNWIYANSVHTIDLLRFFGGEVIRAYTIAQRRFGEARGDQFGALLELDSGAIGQYCAHWYSPGGWRVVLYGDGATVEFKPLEKGAWMGKDLVAHGIEPDEMDVKWKPGFYGQLTAFGKLVRDGVQERPALDLAGSYETMRLAQQMTSNIYER